MLHSDISASVAHKVTWFECFVLTVHVLSECDKNWRRLSNLNTLQPTDFNPKDRQRNNSRKKVGDRVAVRSWKCILKMELSVWVHLHHQSPIYLPTDTHKVVVDDYLLALLPMCTCAAGKKVISSLLTIIQSLRWIQLPLQSCSDVDTTGRHDNTTLAGRQVHERLSTRHLCTCVCGLECVAFSIRVLLCLR